MFSVGERRRMLEELTADFKNVRVDVFDGLTVDYAARVKASAVLRGIRALSDSLVQIGKASLKALPKEVAVGEGIKLALRALAK